MHSCTAYILLTPLPQNADISAVLKLDRSNPSDPVYDRVLSLVRAKRYHAPGLHIQIILD